MASREFETLSGQSVSWVFDGCAVAVLVWMGCSLSLTFPDILCHRKNDLGFCIVSALVFPVSSPVSCGYLSENGCRKGKFFEYCTSKNVFIFSYAQLLIGWTLDSRFQDGFCFWTGKLHWLVFGICCCCCKFKWYINSDSSVCSFSFVFDTWCSEISRGVYVRVRGARPFLA